MAFSIFFLSNINFSLTLSHFLCITFSLMLSKNQHKCSFWHYFFFFWKYSELIEKWTKSFDFPTVKNEYTYRLYAFGIKTELRSMSKIAELGGKKIVENSFKTPALPFFFPSKNHYFYGKMEKKTFDFLL